MRARSGLKGALTVVAVAGGVPAWAAGTGGESLGFWTVLFLSFGALVILLQAIPAVVMFGSMIQTVFSRSARRAAAENKAEHTG